MVIAGGDGSIMPTICNAYEQGINIDGIVFAHLPYGYCNDLAYTLGWGT